MYKHRFILAIPVADRPKQLAQCLRSLEIWQTVFNDPLDLQILIIEDSLHPESIAAHQALLAQSSLPTVYFSLQEQANYFQRYRPPYCGQFEQPQGHKGASITRNLSYLKLKAMGNEDCLYWFIDSDQEFLLPVAGSEQPQPLLNYFQYLDQLFSQHPIQVLTGKVVGDPPVSPAVMSANFLQDILALMRYLQQVGLDSPCRLHHLPSQSASYHDMADLFALKTADSVLYSCPLQGEHTHGQSWDYFCSRLHRFFDGEHLTRFTPYEPQPVLDSVQPARTVYTGNYVLNTAGLNHMIPFAELKLRMAGPSLGRLLKARLGPAFVSAHLPLLHRRSLEELDQAEYRVGITKQAQHIDISQEFERQFWGDVLLFSLEKLTELGYPSQPISPQRIKNELSSVQKQLKQRYQQQRERVQQALAQISTLPIKQAHLDSFIQNMAWNFIAPAPVYKRIEQTDHLDKLVSALTAYPQKQADWQQIMRAIV